MRRNDKLVYSTDSGAFDNRPATPGEHKDRGGRGARVLGGETGTVYVERERKGRRGKTVTVVTGLPVGPEKAQQILKRFKAMCGAGGTLKADTLEIQGDHRDRIVDALADLGYKVKARGG